MEISENMIKEFETTLSPLAKRLKTRRLNSGEVALTREEWGSAWNEFDSKWKEFKKTRGLN